MPWVSQDTAVWGQAIGPLTGNDPLKYSVAREADLSTGKLSTLADHAGLPAIAWPWVAWAVAESHDTGYVQVTNLESGQQQRIAVLSPTFTLHGSSAAYNIAGYHTVCLIDDLATDAGGRPILSDPDTSYEWITLNDRAMGYSQITDLDVPGAVLTQVYDRKLDSLVDLPIGTDLKQAWAVGPLVVWQTSMDTSDTFPTIIQVVDTRDITP